MVSENSSNDSIAVKTLTKSFNDVVAFFEGPSQAAIKDILVQYYQKALGVVGQYEDAVIDPDDSDLPNVNEVAEKIRRGIPEERVKMMGRTVFDYAKKYSKEIEALSLEEQIDLSTILFAVNYSVLMDLMELGGANDPHNIYEDGPSGDTQFPPFDLN